MQEIKQTIEGKEVIFEAVEMVDKHGHSNEWAMDGYTGDVLTHTASGSYTYFGGFEDLTDIEKI